MRNDQQPTCPNVTSRNQTLTINQCLVECPYKRHTRKKYNIQSNVIRYREVEKVMKYLNPFMPGDLNIVHMIKVAMM